MLSAYRIEETARRAGAKVARSDGGRTIEVEHPGGRFEVWMAGPGGFQLIHTRQIDRAESAKAAA